MATKDAIGTQVTTSPHFKWLRGFILKDGSIVMGQENEKTVTVASGIHGIKKFPIDSPVLTLDLSRNANVGMLADLLDKALEDKEYGFELDYGNQQLRVYDDSPDFNVVFEATWLTSNIRPPEYCVSPTAALAQALLAVDQL